MENASLSEQDFQQLAKGDRGAFLPFDDATTEIQATYASEGLSDAPSDGGQKRIARIVSLPKGMRLFKLDHFEEKWERDTISAWRSTVLPYQESDLGAREVFETALANGVSLREFVRFISAVSVDWNLLDWYVEIALAVDIKAFWGQFAPQSGTHQSTVEGVEFENRPGPGGGEEWVRYDTSVDPDSEVYLPDVLGGFGSWQVYVPDFKKQFIDPKAIVNIRSVDTSALAAHFGVGAERLQALKAQGDQMKG